MSFSTSSEGKVPGFALKKFESQNEVDEKKRKRQEEWEKVRKPDDPEGMFDSATCITEIDK